jgi:segregation and condensation protein A
MDGAGADAESPRATAPVTLDAAPTEGSRVRVDVAGYAGPLDELVRKAQHGDIDLATLPVAAITDGFRRLLERDPGQAQLQDVADFLTLAARLVALKAAAALPDAAADPQEDDLMEADGGEAGRRLAEYRLFKAAADALLGGAVEEGARSFLGLVAPEVIPVERMRIPAERLAAAFRSVLERLSAAEPLPVGVATFSVEEKLAELRSRLSEGPVQFEELFSGVATRLEAVASFLALLELLKRDEASVEQKEPFGPITVTANG